MSLVFARVDQRLVHGQVVVGWVPTLAAGRILVVDDEIAGDEWERDMLVSATPPGVEAEVVGLAEAPGKLREDSGKTLLLVRSLATMLSLVREGCVRDEVNVGGLHARPGARRFLDYVYLTEDDVAVIRELDEAGVRVRACDVPGNPTVDLNARLTDGQLDYHRLPDGP